MLAATFGARVAHRTSGTLLRKVLAVLLLLLATRMLWGLIG